MKKQTYSIILCALCLFLISLSVLAATPHQRPLTATEDNKLDNQQAADQNPEQPDQFTAADKQLIPFTVTSNPKTGKVEAKITDLQAAALDMGMDEMVIEGIQRTRTKPDGTKEVTILWTGAYKINPDNGKKITTSIQKPLDSKLIVKNKIVEGDSFNAEGNPLELIAAWKRLNAEQPVTPEKKKEGAAETNGANTQKTDTAGVPADTPPTDRLNIDEVCDLCWAWSNTFCNPPLGLTDIMLAVISLDNAMQSGKARHNTPKEGRP